MKKRLNVVSYFDGMSCGRIALDRLGLDVASYSAFEIDKYSISVSQKNYPSTDQLGSVVGAKLHELPTPDLFIGGSPCQGFSFAGKQLNFEDPRSKLFFEYVNALNFFRLMNDKVYFILENVKMKKEYQDAISKHLGVEPIEINSSLVSAQNRKRLYWTNVPGVKQPLCRGISLASILEDLPDCPIGFRVREKSKCVRVGGRNSPFGSSGEWDSLFQRVSKEGRVKRGIDKASCLTGGGNSGGNHSDMDIIHSPFVTRRYSCLECERLQTVPDNYTEGVSNSQRYKMLGNGWTVDVIAHILKSMV